jgi:hypothetical protein
LKFTRAAQSQERLRFSLPHRAVIRRFRQQGSCLRLAQHRIPGTQRLLDRPPDRLPARFPALRSPLRRAGATYRVATVRINPVG